MLQAAAEETGVQCMLAGTATRMDSWIMNTQGSWHDLTQWCVRTAAGELHSYKIGECNKQPTRMAEMDRQTSEVQLIYVHRSINCKHKYGYSTSV
jgi:hypothetical protein